MKKKLIAVAIAVLMILAVSVPDALAYFTTYARVKGSGQIHLFEQVDFQEGPSEDGNKLITLTVDEESGDVFVRVLAFATDDILKRLSYKNVDEWSEEEDRNCNIYEYNRALSAGESVTLELIVDTKDLEAESFNVVVIYEYVPAIGETPDWNSENIEIVEIGG